MNLFFLGRDRTIRTIDIPKENIPNHYYLPEWVDRFLHFNYLPDNIPSIDRIKERFFKRKDLTYRVSIFVEDGVEITEENKMQIFLSAIALGHVKFEEK